MMLDSAPDTRRLVRSSLLLAGGFAVLYLLTRSSILPFGAQAWIDAARGGSPADLHYGEPGHFLQVVTSRGIWMALVGLGLPIPIDSVFIGLSVAGSVAAVAGIGLIADRLLQQRAAAWMAALLFGTSLAVWTNANGELHGLALGGVTTALFLALGGRVVLPALLWALAVLAHVEYALAAPAFLVALWIARPTVTITETVRRAFVLFLIGGATTLLVLLLGAWAIGKWNDTASLMAWLQQTAESRDVALFEPARAFKGLVTALTVGGHFWRDILTGRGSLDDPAFLAAAAVGLVVLAGAAIGLAASLRQGRVALFALVWLLPSHMLLNWRFAPTVEKHHAAALPAFVLLITAGLIFIGGRLSARARYLLYGGFIAASAGLNLFGAVLPMRALGPDTDAAELALRGLSDQHGGKVSFVSCDASRPLIRAGVRFLRSRSIWIGSTAEIEAAIVAWTRARIAEGDELYVFGRWCLPEQWRTPWSKAPFDLFFLEREFILTPTSITQAPVGEDPQTNPFTFRTEGVVRLAPAQAVTTTGPADR